MKKSLFILSAAVITLFGFASCNKSQAKKSAVQEIISQAENMTFDELCQKAIEESKNATLKIDLTLNQLMLGSKGRI